jgi:uncharacterized protein (DUF433 family)
MMQLEDYFDFFASDDIRIKGTRIGIETVLYDFIHRSRSPQEIVDTYPSLSLEQVYATILYYLHNREAVSTYLSNWMQWSRDMRRQQAAHPSPEIQRLRQIKAEKLAHQSGAA